MNHAGGDGPHLIQTVIVTGFLVEFLVKGEKLCMFSVTYSKTVAEQEVL